MYPASFSRDELMAMEAYERCKDKSMADAPARKDGASSNDDLISSAAFIKGNPYQVKHINSCKVVMVA